MLIFILNTIGTIENSIPYASVPNYITIFSTYPSRSLAPYTSSTTGATLIGNPLTDLSLYFNIKFLSSILMIYIIPISNLLLE
jgi:hypothetical protein